MRQLSYALIEIPRIGRSVLVCDQVGEATFVIHGLGDPGRYLTMTKEQLQNELGSSVHRIVRHTTEQWHSDLGMFLFTEEAWQQIPQQGQRRIAPASPSRTKLDVARFVEVRDAIFMSQYNTPESWINMSNNDAMSFKPLGLTLYTIARSMGVEGKPNNKKIVRLECARIFFGDNPVLVQEIEKRKSIDQAPPGWMMRKSLARELGINSKTLASYLQPHLSRHPEWEKEYLDKSGRAQLHLSPELCDLVRREGRMKDTKG